MVTEQKRLYGEGLINLVDACFARNFGLESGQVAMYRFFTFSLRPSVYLPKYLFLIQDSYS